MRGEIFRYVPRGAQGHQQSGPRYAVVVQDDSLLHLSAWLVVPTTGSDNAAPAVYRPSLVIEGRSGRVLCEQVRNVPVSQLREHVGFCVRAEMSAIDRGLRLALGL